MLIFNSQQPLLPPSNDVFRGRPDEIRALRRALDWSPERLGLALNLEAGWQVRATVASWENGLARPAGEQAARLVQLVNVYRDRYLKALGGEQLRATTCA